MRHLGKIFISILSFKLHKYVNKVNTKLKIQTIMIIA